MRIIDKILDFSREKLYEYSNDIIDAILDISLVTLTVLSLVGCSATPSEPIQTAQFHPNWPEPYEVCDVEWKVFVIKEEPYVALSFDDNLKLASCSVDVVRYIKEINFKFCHYRPEGDSRCVYKVNKKE